VLGESVTLVDRAVEAASTAGFDTARLVHAEALTPAQRRRVERVARDLTGTAVEGDGDDKLVLRSLLDRADVSVNQTVVQIRFTTRSTYQRALEALRTGETDVDGQPTDREAEAERLAALLDRQVNRSLVSLSAVDDLETTRTALADSAAAARLLAAMVGDAVTVAAGADRLEGPLCDPTATAFESAVESLLLAVDATTEALLKDPTVAAAGEVIEHAKRATAQVETLDESLRNGRLGGEDRAAVFALTRAINAVGLSANRATDIATVTLRAAACWEELS
jgi:hypothetical protein